MTPSLSGGFDLPFAEQIATFRQKLNLPTEAWDDIWQAAHDRAFVVAGATKADLLDDLRQAVDKAIATGTTLETFRNDFREIVARHGWQGWTGEGTPGGFAWRTRTIYETNLRSSYAAGRWAQLNDPRLAALMPYWRYVHNDRVVSPRPQHKRWGDMRLTLPRQHEFWKTHFPPNGWGCRCRVTAVAGPKKGDATAPPEGWNAIDERTGAPVGIDKGWAYAPGASNLSLRRLAQDKLITYPPAITKALSRDVNRHINAQQNADEYVTRVLADSRKADPLWLGFVDNYEAVGAAAGLDVKGYMILLPDDAPRHIQRSHGNDGGDQRPPLPADFLNIATVLTEADRIEAGHTTHHNLPSVMVWKEIGGETYRAVFEVRPGKANQALSLLSLVIKTAGGS